MCAIYEICEVCNVDHYYDRSVCRWRLAALTLFYLDLHPDHPLVPSELQKIEGEIKRIIEAV